MESTPRAVRTGVVSPGPPQTSVTKRLSGMMDEMMREVFVGEAVDAVSVVRDGGGAGGFVVKALDLSGSVGESLGVLGGDEEVAGGRESAEVEGCFTIPALPSPTRERHVVHTVHGAYHGAYHGEYHGDQIAQTAQIAVGECQNSKEVVLELDVMSPLLKEIREIEKVSKGAGYEREEENEAIDLEALEIEQQGVSGVPGRGGEGEATRVPSLIQYFQAKDTVVGRGVDKGTDGRDGGTTGDVGETEASTTSVARAVDKTAKAVKAVRTQAKRVMGLSKKPPLLPTHLGSRTRGDFSFAFPEGFGEAYDRMVMLATRATQGRRKILAVIALSYLVLLHVFLISGKLKVA